MYNYCCNENSTGIIILIVLIIIILLVLFVNQKRTKKVVEPIILPPQILEHDYLFAYSDVNKSVQAFEPPTFNNLIQPSNTQIVFDQINHSFTLPSGSYKITWSINIQNAPGPFPRRVAFGLSEQIVVPGGGPYPPGPFLPGSIFEQILAIGIIGPVPSHRSEGQVQYTFDEPITLQLREAIGTTVTLDLGTVAADGLDHSKCVLNITKLTS